jgi:hypothetical protein
VHSFIARAQASRQKQASKGKQAREGAKAKARGHLGKGRTNQGKGRKVQGTPLFSLRGAYTLYQVPLFHFLFVAFA